MNTYSGIYFDPVDPKPSQIELLDIAVALSRVPRWVGHTHHFYSVSEHSILVSELAVEKDPNNKHFLLQALFHDAAEAYVSDIPSPVKLLLKPTISNIEDNILNAIYSKFNINIPTVQDKIRLKELDNLALAIEDKYLRNDAWKYIMNKEQNKVLPFMNQDQAALAFMRQFYLLNNKG